MLHAPVRSGPGHGQIQATRYRYRYIYRYLKISNECCTCRGCHTHKEFALFTLLISVYCLLSFHEVHFPIEFDFDFSLLPSFRISHVSSRESSRKSWPIGKSYVIFFFFFSYFNCISFSYCSVFTSSYWSSSSISLSLSHLSWLACLVKRRQVEYKTIVSTGNCAT